MSHGPFLPRLLLLAALILVNAFFAAAEIAVISLSETRLRRQAGAGDQRAQRLLKLTQAPDRFLSAIQIAITLAGFLSSAFAADSFSDPLAAWLMEDCGVTVLDAHTLNNIMVVLITLALSYFSLVLGELVPKRIAMNETERVARFILGPVCAVAAVFRPVIWLLSKSTNGVLRLLRVKPRASQEQVNEEDIRMMADLGQEQGTIRPAEKELIDNIFKFSGAAARDVMVHRTDMVMVWAQASHGDVLNTILTSGRSRFPVYEEDADHIVGILSARDYLLNAQRDAPKPLAALLHPACFVPDCVPASVLFQEMQRQRVHMVIVADEYGGTSGLVTLEDLLEEIVGSIYDEFDPAEEQDLQEVEPGVWKASGSCGLDRLAQALGTEVPQEGPGTLGGLVFAQLSAIPQDGGQLEVDAWGLHIRVQSFAGRRVEWALVSRLEPAPAPEQDG